MSVSAKHKQAASKLHARVLNELDITLGDLTSYHTHHKVAKGLASVRDSLSRLEKYRGRESSRDNDGPFIQKLVSSWENLVRQLPDSIAQKLQDLIIEVESYVSKLSGAQFRHGEDPTSTLRQAGEDVDVASDEVFPLLETGQSVETPLGTGKIIDISIHAAKYGDKIEMEPPSVRVKLDKPKEGDPEVVNVCMCKLGLGDEEKEAIISKEFARLWPPITEDIPKDTRMVVDVEEEFDESKVPEDEDGLLLLHKSAFADYISITTGAGLRVADNVDNLEPGIVLTDLEGGDQDDDNAVVLKKEKRDDGYVDITLYLPDSNTTKTVTVSDEASWEGYSSQDLEIPTPTVYDPERMSSEELHTIRVLPDTYLPKNPNYPSSITNTIWRPTVRQTPIRFYSVDDAMKNKKAGFEHKPEQGPGEQSYWPPQDYVNYPTPDYVPYPQDMLDYKSGPSAYGRDEEEMEFKRDKKLEELALKFWHDYQIYRDRKIPGATPTLNTGVEQYANVFAFDNDLDENEIRELFQYMVNIGLFPQSTYELLVRYMDSHKTPMPFRTHYPNV